MLANLQETGHCEWVDADSQSIIIPVSYLTPEIPIPVKQRSDRSTLLAAIAANAYQLNRLLIIHRRTIETDLEESGLPREVGMSRTQRVRLNHIWSRLWERIDEAEKDLMEK
jgi:hypothetical protein